MAENINNILERKKCIACEKNLPLEHFAKRFRKRGPWYQSNCKNCSLALKRKRRADRKKRDLPATLYVGDKWCRGHQKDEPKINFGQNKTNADFLDNYCKVWRKEEYRKKHPKKEPVKKEEEPVKEVYAVEIESASESVSEDELDIGVENDLPDF